MVCAHDRLLSLSIITLYLIPVVECSEYFVEYFVVKKYYIVWKCQNSITCW